MFKSKNYKDFSILLIVLLCICVTIGNFVNFGIFSRKKISLGLDLRGGSHLLLEVNFNYYINEQLSNDLELIKDVFLENRIKALPKIEDNKIIVFYKNDSDVTNI